MVSEGWRVADQRHWARHEEAYLCGLYVIALKEMYNYEVARAVQSEFARRCEAAECRAR